MITDVTDRTFDRLVEEATVPVLVEFWKPGCGSCRALLRQLVGVQEETAGKLLVVKMNVEENHQIPAELEISSLPVLALYRRGRFDRFIGGIGTREALLAQLTTLLDAHGAGDLDS
ncbi:Thioredoxin [Nitrospira japonica]|uniref:Thioredoxin n=1 Tax=Nitrospira japonica TaxID=1325564 RepID=A0A1W1IAV2_9BACT|nr:thioredoxin domain-containing protein [Nitrospira japonica]SLM49903.1 Thioredoxin [Nitrospira japonica]